LRHAHEESHVGVETGDEKEGLRGAECPREAGFERSVGMVIDEETRSPGPRMAGDEWSAEDACAKEMWRKEEVVGEVDWG